MRVITGVFGGRTLDAPHGRRTHPMGDRVRGGLFNTLGDIAGLSVFDAFAGSGALSFEALSRGAGSAIAVDIDKSAAATIEKNAQSLGAKEHIKVIRANASSWSDNNVGTVFDIVLLDPPYDGIKPALLEKLAAHAKPGGIVVLSLPPRTDYALQPDEYRMLAANSYGDAKLVFYRRNK